MRASALRTQTIVFLSLLWCLGCFGTFPTADAEVNVRPTGAFVVDEAHVLSPQSRQDLEILLKALKERTGDQVEVLTVPDLEGEDIFAFSQRHADNWKLGGKGKDNGALIVLAVKDHKVRVHTYYGLEGVLPDQWIGTLSRRIANEYFRQGQFDAGLSALTTEVVKKVAAEHNLTLDDLKTDMVQPTPATSSACTVLFVIFVVLLFLWIARRQRCRRYWRGGWGDVAYWGSALNDVLRQSSRGGYGSFGGGSFGGGFGGGGGGFGGGGRSGGGGGGASW